MINPQPRIWVLLGHRTGSNNQLLALAEALKLPFETRTVRFNLLRILHRRLGASLLSLDRASRRRLSSPWPDLIIGHGWRSVAVACWLKRASGGRAKLVRIDDPRARHSLFDLVITTPQYPVPDGPNVLKLPLAMSRFRSAPAATEAESAILNALPRPHRLMAVGGPAKYWTLTTEQVVSSAGLLGERSGSLIVTTSPRTPDGIKEALRRMGHGKIITGREPRFSVLLADADEIYVTGDSVGMLSEAILAGKPVGIIPIEMNSLGKRVLGSDPAGRRDLRRFWSNLRDRGLAGTIDHPVAGQIADPAEIAADAVRALLVGHA